MPLPSEIKVIAEDVPKSINIDAINVPSAIELIAPDLPAAIILETAHDFPTSIKLDATDIPDTIQVVGIPSTIELSGNIPSVIELKMPEDPEIEMVYRGSPIDVKVELDIKKLTGGDDENGPACVAIIPCPQK
jgi:hypothetical protein